MSLDLFIVRAEPLSWADARRACDAISHAHPDVTFWSLREDGEACTGYFWQVGRVDVALTLPETDDPAELADGDPPELAKPYLVVSSSSGAWPWIEWLACTLASALGAHVFDPQNGEPYEAAEHTISDLRELHEEDLRERKPKLMSNYWASTKTTDKTSAGLRAVVDVVDRVASDVLGILPSLAVKPDQVNLSHRYEHAAGAIGISLFLDPYQPGGAERSIRVEGPAGAHAVAQFADELGRRLGVRFRRIDEYV